MRGERGNNGEKKIAFLDSLGPIESFGVGQELYLNCNFSLREDIKRRVCTNLQMKCPGKKYNKGRDCKLFMNNIVLSLFHSIRM